MLIYLIVNRVNGKYYVGKWQKKDVQARWKMHLWHAQRGSVCAISRAIRKYGETAFSLHVLLSNLQNKEQLNQAEIEFISFLRACNPQFGYNMTAGGDRGFQGLKRSIEWKRWKSEAMKGSKNPMFGKPTRTSFKQGTTVSVGIKRSSEYKEKQRQTRLLWWAKRKANASVAI